MFLNGTIRGGGEERGLGVEGARKALLDNRGWGRKVEALGRR